MKNLLRRTKRLRFRSLNRGELTDTDLRPVENTDAMTAARASTAELGSVEGASIPPNYVKSYDEGRPRH
jgi:hypothetical protein